MADTNADGVAEAAYNRFDVSRDGSGFAQVLLNRVAWCPDKDTPAQATVRVGPIGVGPDNQPAIAEVTGTQTKTVNNCKQTGFAIGVPASPGASRSRCHRRSLRTSRPEPFGPATAGRGLQRRLPAVLA